MNRICNGCGWEYPSSSTSIRKCKFCKTIMSTQWCTKCKQWLPLSEFKINNGKVEYQCKKCHSQKQLEYYERNPHMYDKNLRDHIDTNRRRKEDFFSAWIDTLSKLPKINPLTEAEWLQACKHFRGCALCDETHIEVRSLFISGKHGGKYNKVNVFPACVKCGTRLRRHRSPYASVRIHTTDDKFNMLVDYLQGKIKEVQDGATRNDSNND